MSAACGAFGGSLLCTDHPYPFPCATILPPTSSLENPSLNSRAAHDTTITLEIQTFVLARSKNTTLRVTLVL